MDFGPNLTESDAEEDVPPPFESYRSLPTRAANLPALTSSVQQPPEDLPAGILSYWNLLAKWRWLMAACLIMGILAGVAVTLTTMPVYRAVATIQIDSEPAKVKPIESQDTYDYDSADKYYQTQYELLKSRSLAERVVAKQNLAEDDAFLNQWTPKGKAKPATAGPISETERAARAERAAAMVMGNLAVEPVRSSRVVKITYESPDPAVAARTANAIAQTYIAWNLDRRYEASASARKFLEDRLQQTRQTLEDAQRRGNAYAQANELITIGQGSATPNGGPATGESLVASDLASMNAALATATDARIQAEQKWRQAEKVPDLQLPDVIANPAVRTLRENLDEARAAYLEGQERFLPDYPKMQEAKAKVAALEQQLADQARSIRNSLQTQYQYAANYERQLQGEVNKRKSQLLSSQGKRVEQGFIDTEVSTTRSLYDSMLSSYKEIGIAGAVQENNISMVDQAKRPGAPFKPETRKNLLLFGFAGLALGVLLSLFLEAFDLTMKVPGDIEKHLGLPVLGTIPLFRTDRSIAKALEDVKSALSESYYSVRVSLQFSTESGAPETLLVTSALPGEGKSTTALAVAESFASLGYSVLLVDADLRAPSLHKMLSRDNTRGLSNLLASDPDAGPTVQSTGHERLKLLPSGPVPPNPAALLGGNRMREFLNAARARFDIVVIDGPPVMGLADAPQLAGAVDGVALVVEAAKTKRDLARGALKRLRAGNANVLGAVMTKFELKKAGYAYAHAFGSGYGYGYGVNYGTSAPRKSRLRKLLKFGA